MSTFNTIAEASVALKTAKLSKPDFIAWASSRQTDTMALLTLFSVDKLLSLEECNGIISAQQALAATPKAAGSLYCKTSKRGAISIYGLNHRMPVTLYKEQAERLVKWLNAPADNPISKHIAENKPVTFKTTDFEKDQELLAEILVGKHPHAKVENGVIVCVLSSKPAKA